MPTFSKMMLRRVPVTSNTILGPNMTALCFPRARSLYQTRLRRNQEDPSSRHHSDKELETAQVGDAEWELRAGRALALIKETLPTFFATGLVERASDDENTPSIYSPKIQLQYTPLPPTLPVPLPFPQTLQIDGLPLYRASSVFVRHGLAMFYTDLRLELRSCRVLPYDTNGENGMEKSAPTRQKGMRRERRFAVGFAVLGLSRMGGGRKEWDVLSTYYISPVSGQVSKHVVESIRPAPHKIYATLAAAFGRFAVFRSREPEPAVPGVGVRACPVDTQPTRKPTP